MEVFQIEYLLYFHRVNTLIMFLKYWFIVLVLLLGTSCDFFEKKIGKSISSYEIDTVIDFTKVDQFPTFKSCDTLLSVADKNTCFKKELYKRLAQELMSHTFIVENSIDEIVNITIEIDRDGSASLLKVNSSSCVKNELPILDSLIVETVYKLPKIIPAIKNGIPVTTVYEIPVIIKID